MIQYVSAVIHGVRLVHGKEIFLDKGDVLVIEIETPDGGFDLIAAAKEAALEYCKTEGGKEYFCKGNYGAGTHAGTGLPQSS